MLSEPAPPRDQRHAKGLVGRWLERVLGATSGNASQPDFAELGVELKTIPLDRNARPLESTFVCTVPLLQLAELEWEHSPVHAKLRRVLWIPLESGADLPLPARRIGAPRLWSPSAREDAALRADFEQLSAALVAGEAEQLRAHVGRYLQVRPKGANRDSRVRASDADGAPLFLPPRGFYLRTAFTARLFAADRPSSALGVADRPSSALGIVDPSSEHARRRRS